MEVDSFAMNGGDGPTGYFVNSRFQRIQCDEAKALLQCSIQKHLVLPLDSKMSISKPVFRIADLGCSVGPNTFASVDSIIDAVTSEYKAKCLDSKIPEFQVFFNDQARNDFNTLFRNLPAERAYTAAGIPGSFHGRLFPMASVDIFHSASALHWLSGVPDEVKDPLSPAWNRGKVTYVESAPEVAEAYKAQFQKDIMEFFNARAMEIADNGLLAILMLCRPEGTAVSCSVAMDMFECLGHTLVDMVNEGLIEEALVDSFNMPLFFPTASEMTEVISEIQGIRTEVVEEIQCLREKSMLGDTSTMSLQLRAITEEILNKHFGPGIIDTIFQRMPQKFEEYLRSPSFAAEKLQNLFLLVKKVTVSSG
ncbi:hypothetical protein SAY87_013281 [Trapa incisa]|uniref:S-adenosylmethionine-dependent methyltransferase n=1 Tax=Trapa incisa TaxID=236973 RepID=A0AAN7K8G3_9MYRT|nr:hypothetical protein SAY87_013281 [Trapa incisa]